METTETKSGEIKASSPPGNDSNADTNAGDLLHVANSEIRHLHGTIEALRNELESQRIELGEDVQKATSSSAGEIRQLHQTVAAMRDDMDVVVASKESAVQEAVSSANSEIRQLKDTANSLRDQLEIAAADKAEIRHHQ